MGDMEKRNKAEVCNFHDCHISNMCQYICVLRSWDEHTHTHIMWIRDENENVFAERKSEIHTLIFSSAFLVYENNENNMRTVFWLDVPQMIVINVRRSNNKINTQSGCVKKCFNVVYHYQCHKNSDPKQPQHIISINAVIFCQKNNFGS